MFRTTAIVFALSLVACGAPQSRTAPAAHSQTKPVRVAVEVSQKTTFAGSFKTDVAGEIRQRLLSSGVAVPVEAGADSDLVLKVLITRANFSNATGWEWQLIDPGTRAIVASKVDTAALGRNAGPLASDIVRQVTALDLTPYAGDGGTAVAAASAPKQATTNPASSTDGSNAWAVIVGIESYRESLPKATGAQADAEAFAAYAKSTLNVPDANIKLLTGERASRADLSGALTEWLPRNANKPGGRVYVFFSGHGAPNIEDGTAYLLPYDANPSYIKSSGFAVKTLQDQLAALEGQTAYVFLDACFSGIGDRSVVAEGTRPLVPVKEVAPVGGVVTFAAAGAKETSGAAPNSNHGLFSYHLLAGLRGAADANSDGVLAAAELQAYVAEHVSAEARRQNREQTPTVAGDTSAIIVSGLQP